MTPQQHDLLVRMNALTIMKRNGLWNDKMQVEWDELEVMKKLSIQLTNKDK